MTVSENAQLLGTSRAGDFVLKTQTLATEQGFRNVAKSWYDKTRPISVVLADAEANELNAENLSRSPNQIVPTVGPKGHFLFKDLVTERILEPSLHSIHQLASICGIGATYPSGLFRAGRFEDSELLGRVFTHHLQRSKLKNRAYLFRIRSGSRLTGIVSEGSTVINNCWYLRLLNRLVPDGRVSHRRGSQEDVLGNILIPDTIRQEADSEYGAMLAVSNSEVLEYRFCQRPSLFRAICMNGCIWGQERGNALTAVGFGRGNFSSNDLAKAIEKNLIEQIPLCVGHIDRLLSTRDLSTGVSMKPVIAQIAKDYRLSKLVASAVLAAWNIEKQRTPELASTLFGLINGITRAAQGLDVEQWRQMDELGGQLIEWKPDRWSSLVTRASTLSVKEVQKSFGHWTMPSPA